MIPDRVRPILDECRPLAERFAAAGHRLYLVGGIVRDLLLDRDLDRPDLDFTTDARPERDQGRSSPRWPTRCGTRAPASAPSAPRSAAGRARSRPTGPRPTHPTRASPTSSSPTPSRPTSPGATSPSTPWRSLLPADDAVPSSSTPSTAWPTCSCTAGCARRSRPRSRSPTTRCGCCGPPASSPATGSRPTRASCGRRAAMAAPPRRRVGRAHPRRAAQAARRRRPRRRPVVPARHRAVRALPARDPGACGSSRTRSTGTRTCSPTRSPSSATCAPASPTARPTTVTRLAALLHDIGKPRTRGYGPKGVTFHHHEVVGARMARERLQALQESTDVVDDVTPPRRAAPALPRLRRGRRRLDRRRGAPLRARRRATCSTS